MLRSLLCLLFISALGAEPVRLILDTDIGNDVDDTLALAMIHSLENRGEVHLLAVTITKDNQFAAPFVNLVNTYYGRAAIPIGMVRHGMTPEDAPMLRVPAEGRDLQGHLLYPHALTNGGRAVEAVGLLRQILDQQPDQSVTIAQIGFSTNLARLIETKNGRELVKRKVKLLSVMGGNFEASDPEYNIKTDAKAAKALFKDWPTPVIVSGFEVGLKITFPYQAIENDFNWTAHNPIVDAYRLYVAKSQDHPNWDSTAVLYAIRPERGYFELSPPGTVTLNRNHATEFVPQPNGQVRYLILKADKVELIKAVIEDLVSEPAQTSAVSIGTQRVAF